MTFQRLCAGSTQRIPDELMFKTLTGPLAVVRECLECKFANSVKKGIRGAGRGYGMREGNKNRGAMIKHFRECHPKRYAELQQSAREAWSARLQSAVGGNNGHG